MTLNDITLLTATNSYVEQISLVRKQWFRLLRKWYKVYKNVY
jgi:hypothetical protein